MKSLHCTVAPHSKIFALVGDFLSGCWLCEPNLQPDIANLSAIHVYAQRDKGAKRFRNVTPSI